MFVFNEYMCCPKNSLELLQTKTFCPARRFAFCSPVIFGRVTRNVKNFNHHGRRFAAATFPFPGSSSRTQWHQAGQSREGGVLKSAKGLVRSSLQLAIAAAWWMAKEAPVW